MAKELCNATHEPKSLLDRRSFLVPETALGNVTSHILRIGLISSWHDSTIQEPGLRYQQSFCPTRPNERHDMSVAANWPPSPLSNGYDANGPFSYTTSALLQRPQVGQTAP